jgi:hypothetical protein
VQTAEALAQAGQLENGRRPAPFGHLIHARFPG